MTAFLPSNLGDIAAGGPFTPAVFGSDLLAWLDDTTALRTIETAGSFNGSSHYLTTPDTSDFDFGSSEFSVAVWVYPTTFATMNRAIVGSWRETTDQSWKCLIEVTSGKPYLRVSTNGTGEISLVAGTACTVNAWNSIVFVRDRTAAQIKIAVNGGSFTTASYSNANTLWNATQVLRIGTLMGSGSNTYFYGGRMEQLGIWKGYAADSTFVTWWHNSGSGRDYSDVAGSYSSSLVYYNRIKNKPWTASVGGATSDPAGLVSADGKTNNVVFPADDDYLYSWPSRSPATGGAVAQITSGRRPTYNASPAPIAVTLSGSNSENTDTYLVTSGTLALNSAYTIVAALKTSAATASAVFGNTDSTAYLQFGQNGSGNVILNVWNTVNTQTASSYTVGTALTSGSVIHGRLSSGTLYPGQNGTESAGTSVTGTARTGTIAFYVGSDRIASGTGINIKGDLYELLYIGRSLTPTELSNLVSYLRTKWSI